VEEGICKRNRIRSEQILRRESEASGRESFISFQRSLGEKILYLIG